MSSFPDGDLFLDLSKKTLEKKFNVKIARRLGSGFYGTAYLLKGKKKVLKITSDEGEIDVIRKISSLEKRSGKKLTGFVKIFGKPKLLVRTNSYDDPVYGYIREFVRLKQGRTAPIEDWDILEEASRSLASIRESSIPKNIINSVLELAKKGIPVADLGPKHVGKSGRSWKVFDARW